MIDKTNLLKPNTTPILFINWTNEDFTGLWDKQPTTIKAGEQIWLPLWLAEHFAKHLVDRELGKKGLQVSDPTRETLIAKCIGNKPDDKPNDDPLGIKALNANMQEAQAPKAVVPLVVKKKGGRPKKVVEPASAQAPTDEDSFEGK